ncbi:SGNH/GDSL hydrolase family protein [Candidatus Thiodictyon syntrophicum]|jgi:phospholipase/lecithinase/hemolysin|uniref:PEP-CTERM protein-sorting domain-containing protein n=1 Tax=Candidatus Thiodictyon syntrophicum TaxID=1166950 RepID=A0A2K8U9T0_9GAMM|nr:SGNH/GDSL hydrolase family protein [Candidatus Thiodictyon syntrophicum]AUB82340.1 hypothetical protein THSYN_16220 [Candidatus Thiodictyon syntrophicum]
MPPLRYALSALLIAALTPPVAAMPAYSTMYVFGDSLSDNGNLFAATQGTVPTPDYYDNGRFLNGRSYSELLWDKLALPGDLTPVYLGGTNYAVGGARSRYHASNVVDGLPPAVGTATKPFSLLDQITKYEADTPGVFDSNALYLLWLGSNDLFDILSVAAAPSGGPAAAAALMGQSLADIQSSLNTLINNGARRFLLPSIPDIGLTPEIRALEALFPGTAADATTLTQSYNAQLDLIFNTFLGVSGIDLVRFDGFGFLQDAVANATEMGFSNVTDACLIGVFVVKPTGAVSECATPQSYLFWDQIHPSALAHQYLAAGMYDAVPEPAPMLLLGAGLILLLLGPGRQRAAAAGLRRA